MWGASHVNRAAKPNVSGTRNGRGAVESVGERAERGLCCLDFRWRVCCRRCVGETCKMGNSPTVEQIVSRCKHVVSTPLASESLSLSAIISLHQTIPKRAMRLILAILENRHQAPGHQRPGGFSAWRRPSCLPSPGAERPLDGGHGQEEPVGVVEERQALVVQVEGTGGFIHRFDLHTPADATSQVLRQLRCRASINRLDSGYRGRACPYDRSSD